MRVFKLKKNDEHHIGHDIFDLKIQENKKINCIIVSNPVHSNCLCVVNHLVCKSVENKNIVQLIIASEYKQLNDITSFGSIDVGYEYDGVEPIENLVIDIFNIGKNQAVDMLEDNFLIILPGGNIHIKFEEPQEKLVLEMSLEQQVI
ncbi:hypothetical protein [Clostridium sp.]|uniref:hypothetical protein n=1 Tax=Clostridium sp. TaxID=1506 RepID=UPI003D6DA3E7